MHSDDVVDTRAMQRARRYKGCLRCEACNRYVQVDMDFWKKKYELLKSKGTQYIWFCKRTRCVYTRAENLVPDWYLD